jgi:hypothetical protein
MDYSKATKQTLIEEVENLQLIIKGLENKILEQGDIEATIKLKDQAIKNEFDLRKELEKIEEKHFKKIELMESQHFKKIELMESEHFKTIENINALYAEDIEKLKAQIVDPKELEATIVLKDQAVRNEHEARQESNALKEELRIRDAQIKQVNDRLNNLAGLLEEYITAYESDLSFYETLVKKNQHVKQGLRQKIENYNKGE